MRRLLLLLTAGGLLSAAPATPPPPAGSAKPAAGFERTKARIAELLGPRAKPVPLPAILPNPFATATAPATDSGPATPNSAAKPLVPVDLLTRLAQSLKISGQIQKGGQPCLIINSSPYREGDMIPAREGEVVHRLRIKQITSTRVVLEMDGEEITLSIR